MSACGRLLVAAAAVAAASCSPQYGAPPVSSDTQSYGAPLESAAAAQGFGSATNFPQNNGGGFGQGGAAGFGGNKGGRFVSSSAGAGPANSLDGQGMPYNFDWAVREPDYGNNFDHQEKSDGAVTSGQYRVNLPDGRVQIVTYTVEGDSGFQATVTYEGEAQYPPAGAGQGGGGGFSQGGGGFSQGGGGFGQGGGGFSQGASNTFGQQSANYNQQSAGSGFQSQENGGAGLASTPSTSYGAF
ncbi:Pro-resilin [Amphibalanus amphitrite]|uniref:Pro-resilin n=1 Tax=Amphibalanus amphitrite TaxID=1232801 RepID=A0A6A4VT70_AMPAM|nr:pro-resilin-like isoform X1 [Amphibalanus amphitrite]XP_043193451.1 pro-resilin-like isoform X1 [Amphibalanus amphitrite]XP_043193452.1 pro-resilin-like isoform X1 [Amphibalanus amphitrite]XP_043193453.1 pro-resilin-like isoform X1 [Amphibalanus amphitrite]XP_043193454.1 pro-resilin-like isoform X1 [Amphibalanus amphitrite]XP_043193455.1 pro-resilin-like isoform X2 [Amphibalanus amphitrite]KAF0297996.1 Pro-resilin [Amphibalanus amphitrite]